MLTTPDTATERSEAFEAMVSPHMRSLSALAIRLTRDASLAQDLVQDTLLKAYRFLHRFESGTNFRAWLSTIMRHLYFSQLRKQSREIPTENVDYFAPATAHADPTEPEFEHLSILTTYLPHLVSDEVFQALQQVPETYRTAVLLADVLDYSYKDMAGVIGCPIGTVMSRLYRGRQKLQEQLQAYAITEGYIRTGPSSRVATPEPARAHLDLAGSHNQCGTGTTHPPRIQHNGALDARVRSGSHAPASFAQTHRDGLPPQSTK